MEFSIPDSYHPSRTLVLLEALAALALFARVAWQRRRDMRVRTLLLGCAVTAIALGLRLTLSQWGWFHENRHGYRYIVEILSGESGYLRPSTYYVLMNFAWL